MALSGEKFVGTNMAMDIAATALDAGILRSYSSAVSKDIHRSTGAGSQAASKLPGEYSWVVTLELWNTDDDTDVRDLFDETETAVVAYILYPKGKTTGEPQRSFNALVSSITEGVEKNGVAPLSVTLEVDGAITRATVPV